MYACDKFHPGQCSRYGVQTNNIIDKTRTSRPRPHICVVQQYKENLLVLWKSNIYYNLFLATVWYTLHLKIYII